MKPQRNKPCPCDSGKKYKKCCYSKDVAEQQAKRYPEHKPMTDKETAEARNGFALLSAFLGSGFIPYHKF